MTAGRDRVSASLGESLAALEALRADEVTLGRIARVAERIGAAIAAGGTLWLFGNGGSAADAQHIAAELVGRFRRDRRPLPAVALTVNSSVLTALGNDFGFDVVFSRQLEATARPGDVAIGISTGGRSENVLNGLRTAVALGLDAVALGGGDGGALGETGAECILVPASDTARIQECHLAIAHALCELVEEAVA